MRNLTEANLTYAVLEKLKDCRDPRFKQVMSSLIRHLHAFVRDVELTEAEWLTAIRFLTATGQKCDEKRQEFILLSDTLGVSMLVDAINHRGPEGATETTVLGPFFVRGAPELASGADVSAGVSGEPVFVSARVSTPDMKPIAGAEVDIWQTDGQGRYDVQIHDLDGPQLRAKFRTAADGSFSFRTVKPSSYPIPTDGPVGEMLVRMGRHPYRPAHIHFMVSAPGYESVITHLFVEGDGYLDSDAVFGVKDSLVVPFVRHETGNAPDGTTMQTPFYTVHYEFGLKTAARIAERV
jgi:hydroxyquinol 1,2-dioxygenase